MDTNGKLLNQKNRQPPLTGKAGALENSCISVSFKYFKRDLQNFEIGDLGENWFISVLDRLSEYTKKTIDEFRDGRELKSLRLHKVDWSKSVLKRADFTWLPESVRNDEESFPFRQVEISMGEGRIIFFMNDSVAYITLFDPKHNMQLCKKYNYKVRRTWPAVSEIDALKSEINKLRKKKCNGMDCPLDQIDLSDEDLMVSIDKDLVSKYNEIIESGTFIDAFENFLIHEYLKT